ncbi:MAG: RuBisCO large subunit C-terminal-like domain-containing protein [Acetobacteraceae bacterium]
MDRLIATYLVRAGAGSIEARARAIAVEQSVEMPLEAIDDAVILETIVGRVEDITDRGNGVFAVRIGLAPATVGADAGQLLNMAFGNTSLHEDVVLSDLDLPAALAARFGGPRHGIAGLRARAGVPARALTCAALKPQGLPPARLAELAGRFARGGIDYLKDDHGLTDQDYAPFAARVAACAEAMRGHRTRYIPSLSGSLDDLRRQARQASDAGVDSVMVAPMLAGWSNVMALGRDFPDLAFLAHPTMGGYRIAPELLIGRLFPLIGADAVVFPTHGGRFGYSATTCRRLADNARDSHGKRPCLPVPAGGMTLARVPEMLDFYGLDIMLLIGGSLLAARELLTEETAAFVKAVAQHRYG